MPRDRNHSCEICGKRFHKLNQLNQHLIIHRPADEKPFRCRTCGKTFNRSHHLKVHSMTHTKEGPHVCDVCGCRCSQRSDLKKHRMIHTGERPHSCPVCGKGFIHAGAVKAHMRSHRKRSFSPVSCDVCGKQYTKVCFLEEHLLSHRTKPPALSCDICGKRFLHERRLKQHSAIHSSKETHKCEKCGKLFKRFLYLEKHTKTHWERFSVKSTTRKKRLQEQTNIECHSKSPNGSDSPCMQVTYSETSGDNTKTDFVSTKVNGNAMSQGDENTLCCLTERDAGEEHVRESSFSDRSVKPEKNGISVIENYLSSQSASETQLLKNKDETNIRKLRHRTVDLSFSCNICRRKFTEEIELKQHAVTHSDKRPHKCEHCGKAFKRLASFEKHMKTHRSSFRCKKQQEKRRSLERHLKSNSASVSQVMQINDDAETLIGSPNTDCGSGEPCEKEMSVDDELNLHWATENDAECLTKSDSFSFVSFEPDNSVICVIENCFSLQSKYEPGLMEEGMSGILWD